eukprot:TRINITY_DN2570_c0_g1_i1.p1 TRINITY_DN2570_c0_g1~~TRINITY_DN2570_c0_g1_i1.p1  ORF type:complete len:226 (+),score=75.45 TRINITY_DN2570_c0_g1_i1:82-759(+)
MPKKFQGANSKAEEAREREATKKKIERETKERQKEDAKWVVDDKDVLRQEARKKAAEEKRQADLQRKQENKALQDKESADLAKKYTKPTDTKVSRFEIEKRREEEQKARLAAEKKAMKEKEKSVDHIEPNVNQLLRQEQEDLGEDAIIARSLTEAIEKLAPGSESPSLDKHPEKRLKAAFAAYEESNLPILRMENPGLKLSQLKEILWKQWQKAPENPLNQVSRP